MGLTLGRLPSLLRRTNPSAKGDDGVGAALDPRRLEDNCVDSSTSDDGDAGGVEEDSGSEGPTSDTVFLAKVGEPKVLLRAEGRVLLGSSGDVGLP